MLGNGSFDFVQPNPEDMLNERQALERVAKIAAFKDWVQALRLAGNAVVYDVTSSPSEVCGADGCAWCFRISEGTVAHRTHFQSYCVDAMLGTVTVGEDY